MVWFIAEYFNYLGEKTREDKAETQRDFEKRLDAALERQKAQRTYTDMGGASRTRYQHLQTDPYYEQRNKMYPHRKYVRRETTSS